MTRKETTKFLSDLLVNTKFSGIGKYYASEVTLDYGTNDVRRVDFMEFVPENQISISGIEKGYFVCYEVKSCVEDYKSGNGRNFIGEKNYFVMPMETYKCLNTELNANYYYVGVMVPVPFMRDTYDEFENPTPFDADTAWDLRIINPCHPQSRKKSMAELLFCMLRAGR